MVLSLVLVTSVLGASKLRGFISLFLGLTIGLVGMDLNTGQPRLSFDQPLLADRLDIVVVAVGIFAIGEALWVAAHLRRTPLEVIPVGQPWMGRDDWGRSWRPWLRGTAIGFPFGAVPAGGAETPTFLSYLTERRLARKRGEFGKGAIEGVAGPEAANNASAAGSFVPLLALGLPVTATAAIMLAALQSFGIQPGPQLMTEQADLVWTLLAALLIGNAMLLVLNLPLAPLWAKLLRIPRPQLYAGILFFAALGAYATNQQPFDVFLLLVFGLLGFMMRRFAFPVLPLILGVILGPLMETKLREALAISGGDVSGLFNEPLAVFVYAITATRHRRAAGDAPGPAHDPGRTGEDRGDERPMSTIVVAWTPNEYGAAALDRGIAEARLRGRRLLVVNATQGDAYVDERYASASRIEALRAELADLDVEAEVRQGMGADIADQVIAAAEDADAEMVVIGVRHRSAVGKLLMGSVAQRVILEATCPVLSVKPK